MYALLDDGLELACRTVSIEHDTGSNARFIYAMPVLGSVAVEARIDRSSMFGRPTILVPH